MSENKQAPGALKPVTMGTVEKALDLHHVAVKPVGDQIQVTTWTVGEMESVKVTLRDAGILYTDGPRMNIIHCIGIKEEQGCV